jgi:ectoine hydroxylase-related dioxygenase (phytanoyl-CoA dioxygenase family)
LADSATELTPAARLERDGYVLFPQVLDPALIDTLAMRAAGTLHRTAAAERERVKSNGSLCDLAGLPEYADLLAHPAVLGALEAVGGRDIRWTGGYLISKPAGGPPLFWHQDWWGWSEAVSYQLQACQLFVMIYLTPTRPENGCLRVIPGSHRRRHALHEAEAAHSDALARVEDPEDAAFADHPDETSVAVQPGDLVVGDARLIHGAHANRSGAERPLLTLWYAPNFSALPERIQARYVAMTAEPGGDIRSDAAVSPHLWPALARERMAGLLPDYAGGAEPLDWNRDPDLERLGGAAPPDPA